MNFEQAMDFVEVQHDFPSSPKDLHAQRTAWLLERTGLDLALQAVPLVVVGGSCGKGSTARFLAAIARACLDGCGVRAPVALYTKPPLEETADGNRERYQRIATGEASNRWIDPEEFAAHVAWVAPFVRAMHREAPHLGRAAPYDLRLLVFARHAVKLGATLAVVEANLGFRDDPTAALPTPALVVLTPVRDDHATLLRPPDPAPAWLAPFGDRAGVVWHKVGGLRRGVPAVIGQQDPATLFAIAREAVAVGAGPLVVEGRDYEVIDRRCTLEGSGARLRLDDAFVDVELRALGRFQVANAAQAAACAKMLHRAGLLPGSASSLLAAVREGVRRVRPPGRMQLLGRVPVTLLNVGATAPKVEGMIAAVEEFLPRARVVVCATFLARVSDPLGAVRALARWVALRAVVVTATSHTVDQADLDPEAVAAVMRDARPDLRIETTSVPADAIAIAQALLQPDDVLVLYGNGLAAVLSQLGVTGDSVP